jgi:hypothetical protein
MKKNISSYKTTALYAICMLTIAILILQITPKAHAAPKPDDGLTRTSLLNSQTTTEANLTSDETALNVNIESLTPEEQIFQEVTSYKENFEAYSMQPGWTLVKYDQHDILPTTGPKPLPQKHQRETWSHFDENKLIFEEIEFATAPEIGTVLLGYFDNGKLVSIWNNESFQQAPYTPSYDFYLSSIIRGLIDGKSEFEMDSSPSEIYGKKALLVELKIAYSEQEKKWVGIKLDQPVWGILERYYFNPDTGMLMRYEHNYIMNDMSIVPASITDNFQIIANTQPPAEALLLVEGK